MLTIGFAGLRRNGLAQLGIVAVPLLLLMAPALHYALDTPIGLWERTPELADIFNSARDFLGFLHRTLTEPQSRFWPFRFVWQGLQWKIFGDLAWPYHLIRWLVCFGAVALFIAAFRRFQGLPHDANAAAGGGFSRIVPAALLAYLWLLFPSPVTVRIDCMELYTVFFLGLCNWAAALLLTAEGGKSAARHHGLFCLGFLGLVSTKEINTAPALWLLICYWAFVIAQGISAKRLLAGAGLTLSLAFAIRKAGEVLAWAEEGGGYIRWSGSTLDRFAENSADILQGLFQLETSLVISAVFAVLLMALIVSVGVKVARRQFGGELAFVVLLLGELMSMFLALSIQWDSTPRYWFILVPCLATLLAFAAKFLLQAAKRRKMLANCTALALAIFIAFFTAANYYNFLYPFIIQHSARNLDDLVLLEVAELLNNGKHVQVKQRDWVWEQINQLNSNFNHRRYWPDSPHGASSLQRDPPMNPNAPYYILDIMGRPGLVSLDAHFAADARTDYGVLDWPLKMAGIVQGESPHVSLDFGMFRLGDYRWAMHAVPHSMGTYLEGLLSKAGEPSIDSFYDLHFLDDKIMYARQPCLDDDIEDSFLLHLHTAELSDLPEGSRKRGFDNLDFHFWDYGVKDDDLCVAMRALPQYPIESIYAGQYRMEDGRTIWTEWIWTPPQTGAAAISR